MEFSYCFITSGQHIYRGNSNDEEDADLVHVESNLARVLNDVGRVLALVPLAKVGENLLSGDSAEGLSGLVTDDGVLVLVVESLDQNRHRVEGEQLAENEADLVPKYACDR